MTRIKGDQPVHLTTSGEDKIVETEGGLHVELESLQKVSIYNIIRVKKYDLSDTGDFIIHNIDFVNGGIAKLGYASSGKLMEFRTRGIAVAIEGDHITLDVRRQWRPGQDSNLHGPGIESRR
jgi:hypothetical protein